MAEIAVSLAAEIAVSFATKLAEGLLENVGSILYSKESEKFSLLLGMCEEIQFIRDELQIMSTFLRSAEEMKDIHLAAGVWVNQVKELAYAVEDCLDDFALHLSQYRNRTFWSRALQTVRSLNDRRRIEATIHSIKNRVKEVSERRWRYGMTTMDRAPTSSDYEFNPRSAALFVEESQLVGLEGPRDKLVALLREKERPQLTLIAVVGEGGLGKTTIVRKAYESPDIAGGHFACRAWITVSQVYSPRVLLRKMIKQLIPEPPQQDLYSRKYEERLATMDEMSLTAMIRKHLKQKRYVIVFDDIWDINAWKSLGLGLPNSNCHSRIMITTRDINLAEACLADTSGYLYRHEKLTELQSMDLFCKKVFFNDDPEQHNTCPEYLKEVTQDILRKCDGLPLAVVSIAGVLATKLKKKETMRATGRHEREMFEEWWILQIHLGSELERNPSLRGVNQVIIFSYNNLPYHIKRCYLYLTKFPEDSLIKRKHILRLWIAEGFVGTRKDMTAEEVAESYFDELVIRCMILPSLFDGKGKVKSFRVQDVMLQVMISKSTEENFLCILQNKNKWTATTVAGGDAVIRRLAVLGEGEHQQQEERSVDPMWEVGSFSRVRSLTISNGGSSSFISPEMGFLRVLDLKGCKSIRGKHLKVICKLLHLKYLSLKDTKSYDYRYPLPKSIRNLQRLETFITKGSSVKKLPIEVLKLRQLRFLSFDPSQADGQLLSMIGRLTELNKLGVIHVSSVSLQRKELRFPDQLRELSLWYEGYDGRKMCRSLEGIISSLRSLKIWDRVIGDSGVRFLNNLSTHFPELESLSLYGQLGTLPTWICRSTKLLKISLGYSGLEEDALKSLGDLPNLLTLNLYEGALREEKISFSAYGFYSLRVLHLINSSVFFEEGALPSLEVLSLQYVSKVFCPEGIEYLNSLKKIVLYKPHGASLEGVIKALDDHPNHPHLTVY